MNSSIGQLITGEGAGTHGGAGFLDSLVRAGVAPEQGNALRKGDFLIVLREQRGHFGHFEAIDDDHEQTSS
jgi:hypothetical protein